jgi:hypothetical protein
MNHTTLALVAILATAAVVIGTFVRTVASPAFAYYSSKTITKQTIVKSKANDIAIYKVTFKDQAKANIRTTNNNLIKT